MSSRNPIITITFAALIGTSAASADQPAPPQETFGEYIANMQVRSAEPIISYCSSELPAIKLDLENEFSLFKAKFREAAAPMLQKLTGDPELSAPVPPELRAQAASIGESMLVQIKKTDPAVYCPGMLANMRAATVEGLRTTIESSFARYTDTATNKPQ